MLRRTAPYLCVLLVAVVLAVVEHDFLFEAQEQSLFLHTRLFFEQLTVRSGGLLTWAGCYLTQLFYYPWLGAGVLCGLWALLMLLMKVTFRLPTAWMPLTLVPVACLLLTVVTLGYWVYFLKLPGALFVGTTGMLAAMALLWGYRQVWRWRMASAPYVLTAAVAGYVLFGFYGLWAVVLMALTACRRDYRRPVDVLAAVAGIVGTPLLCYHFNVLHETNIVNIYWTALPVFSHTGASFPTYYVPYGVLLVVTAVLTLGRFNTQPHRWQQWLQGAVLALTVAGVAAFWYKDDNFHRELSMRHSIERQDWEQALKTAEGVKGEPTRAVCMMRNLALFRLGRLGDEAFGYANGASKPAAPFAVRLVHTVGKMLYLEYGVPNYCYRWCMEDGVEYGWTAERLKLMVKCSLLNGETAAAQQLLSLLKRTDFHKGWAQRYQACLHNPNLMAQDQQLATIARQMRDDDFLTADQSQMERFLIEHFITAESREPLLQELSLMATLQTKNIEQFWRQFYQYTELHREQRVPRHYQEAACLFGHLQNFDIGHMPFDREVSASCEDFLNQVSHYRSQGKSGEQISQLVYPRFHDTYYYDFYFNSYNYVEP